MINFDEIIFNSWNISYIINQRVNKSQKKAIIYYVFFNVSAKLSVRYDDYCVCTNNRLSIIRRLDSLHIK